MPMTVRRVRGLRQPRPRRPLLPDRSGDARVAGDEARRLRPAGSAAGGHGCWWARLLVGTAGLCRAKAVARTPYRLDRPIPESSSAVPPARASLSSDVATVETVADQDNDSGADRRSALVLSGLLLVAGVLIGLSPLIGVVTAGDGSPTTASVAAAFVAVLPGVVALILATRRSVLGLAATAGAGAIGLIRVFADLAVITETDGVTRPELFVETTDRARPFTVGTGAWLLLAADLLMLVVGVLAASRLGAPRSA